MSWLNEMDWSSTKCLYSNDFMTIDIWHWYKTIIFKKYWWTGYNEVYSMWIILKKFLKEMNMVDQSLLQYLVFNPFKLTVQSIQKSIIKPFQNCNFFSLWELKNESDYIENSGSNIIVSPVNSHVITIQNSWIESSHENRPMLYLMSVQLSVDIWHVHLVDVRIDGQSKPSSTRNLIDLHKLHTISNRK